MGRGIGRGMSVNECTRVNLRVCFAPPALARARSLASVRRFERKRAAAAGFAHDDFGLSIRRRAHSLTDARALECYLSEQLPLPNFGFCARRSHHRRYEPAFTCKSKRVCGAPHHVAAAAAAAATAPTPTPKRDGCDARRVMCAQAAAPAHTHTHTTPKRLRRIEPASSMRPTEHFDVYVWAEGCDGFSSVEPRALPAFIRG